MTPTLLAILQILILGIPFAILTGRRRWRTTLGLSFLFGCGVVSLVLLSFSLAGVAWSVPRVTIASLLLFVVAFALVLRGGPHANGNTAMETGASPAGIAALTIDLATLLLVAGYARFATLASPWPWDFWAIWGLKGQQFWISRGIDFAFLAEPIHVYFHPAYPPLLPLLFDFIALVGRGWNDRWLGILYVAFAAAILLIVRDALSEEWRSETTAAVGTLLLAGPVMSPWIGVAELPLLAMFLPGLLFVRRGLKLDRSRDVIAGAVLLGLGALTKNEGFAMAVAACASVLLSGRASRRRWGEISLCFVLPAVWFVASRAHGLHEDLFAGHALRRLAQGAGELGVRASLVLHSPIEQPLFWVAAVAALLVAGMKTISRERFLLGAATFQLCFYFAAYLVTPADVAWHVENSWGRITAPVAVLLGYVAVAMMLGVIRERVDSRALDTE
ncbi:MAG: hypothetical protein WBX15_06960 [Thermoanaerobaculia bacterium]